MDYTIIQRPQCAYQPARQVTAEPRDQQARPDDLDRALADIARQAEAMLTSYPRPGAVACRIVLQDGCDDRGGTRYQQAALGEHETLTITGRDQGPGVSELFGGDITCCEWVHLIAPDRVPALIRILGGHDGDDVLALLADYCQHAQGPLSGL